LLALHEIQEQELDKTGRWPQARHRFRKLSQTRYEPKGFDPDGFWRLPGARDLDDVGRGILRSLYLYREERARTENRPPFKVMGNKVLVAVADQQPRDAQDLGAIKGISKRMVHKYGRGILAAIHRGAGQPLAWNERPRPANGSNRGSHRFANGRPSASCQVRFEALRSWRNATAQARGVDPDIVLTNQALWAVAYKNPHIRADLSHDGVLAPWQVDEFGDELLAVVKNSR
jgi:ribonuclease D